MQILVSVSAKVEAGRHPGKRPARSQSKSAVPGRFFKLHLIGIGLRSHSLEKRADGRGESLETILHFRLLRLVREPELADVFASSVFASIVEHAPGAAKGERGPSSVRIQPLAGAGPVVVGAASPAGGDPAIVQPVDELVVKVVGISESQPFPRHGDDDDPGSGAPMTRPMFDQAQDFFFQAGSADDLA